MSSLLTKAADFFSGGLGSSIVETVKDYFPPSMSEQEKSELSMRITEAANKQANKAAELANEAQAEFNTRIKDLEGTAKDLKDIWFFGPLLIFLRGSQRIVWGFLTLVLDFKIFSGEWILVPGTQENAFYLINLLVLGFLFGERAIKNIMPIITQFMQAKAGR